MTTTAPRVERRPDDRVDVLGPVGGVQQRLGARRTARRSRGRAAIRRTSAHRWACHRARRSARTSSPRARSSSASAATWVDLPAPSPPSKRRRRHAGHATLGGLTQPPCGSPGRGLARLGGLLAAAPAARFFGAGPLAALLGEQLGRPLEGDRLDRVALAQGRVGLAVGDVRARSGPPRPRSAGRSPGRRRARAAAARRPDRGRAAWAGRRSRAPRRA